MKEKVNVHDEDGIKVLKAKDFNIKLEIDSSKKNIADVIKLLDTEKINDINISNVPLEDIVTKIYKGVDD